MFSVGLSQTNLGIGINLVLKAAARAVGGRACPAPTFDGRADQSPADHPRAAAEASGSRSLVIRFTSCTVYYVGRLEGYLIRNAAIW
jgi:hypothetical protein